MPALSTSAPGKVILFGEHAVVYGRPAIAVPVMQVRAKAIITANPRGNPGQVKLQAPGIGLEEELEHLPEEHPLAAAIRGTAASLKVSHIPACTLRVTSTIPVAAGLGSGAAVSVAVIRALSAFLGRNLTDEAISQLAYAVEKLHHGTPSGIDNTVITYNRPVYFVKGQPIETFSIARPFTIVIGDTGIASPTAAVVGAVRQAWQAQRDHYEALFDSIGAIADAARHAIEKGQTESLGMLMDTNHSLLKKLGVSSPELERLVEAARVAGALGAKLSGGGGGGNMIALTSRERAGRVAMALEAAGAARTITTEVRS